MDTPIYVIERETGKVKAILPTFEDIEPYWEMSIPAMFFELSWECS